MWGDYDSLKLHLLCGFSAFLLQPSSFLQEAEVFQAHFEFAIFGFGESSAAGKPFDIIFRKVF